MNAITAEGVLQFARKNFLTGRYEWSQRDELFADDPAVENTLLSEGYRWFDINACTAGYTRELASIRDARFGAGVNVTAYTVPSRIQPYYGEHPFGVNVYLRVRLDRP